MLILIKNAKKTTNETYKIKNYACTKYHPYYFNKFEDIHNKKK